MKVILSPRDYLAYGQDFQIAGMRQHCNLFSLYKSGENYRWQYPSDPDLVVTQNPDDPADSSFIARLGGEVPSMAHVHCRWDYFTDIQQKNIRRTIKHVTAGVVPADFLKREMEALFPQVDWHSVPNGVRVDLFRPSTKIDRDEFRQRHLLPKEMKLVAFSGRLENAKGIQILEAMCKQLSSEPFALFIQFPNWQKIREQEHVRDRYYEIAHRLRQINPKQVIVWGDEAPRFNDRPVRFCDVFLSTSLSEVQPLVVLEALASGVPVVATDSTPDYAEFVRRIPTSIGSQKWLELQPLPPRLKQGAVARSSSLSNNEASDLADALITKINNMSVHDDRQRELLSTMVVQSGFTEATMNARLLQLFDGIIQEFKNENGQLESGETYPLSGEAAKRVPEAAGVVCLLKNNDLAHIWGTPNIRNQILLLLEGSDPRDITGATHFRFELTEEWKARETEMLDENASTIADRKT